MTTRRSINISLVIAFVALLLVGIAFQRIAQERLEARASNHLKTMLTLRVSVLRSHFESLRSETILWSSQAVVVDLLRRLESDFERHEQAGLVALGEFPVETFRSKVAGLKSESVDERAARFAAHHDYYDIFIINTKGDVLYSVAKEDVDHTNLVNGPHADSGLGRMFRSLLADGPRDRVVFEDFSKFGPSDDDPAAFIGSRVYSADEWIGVYGIQIPTKPIDEIMQFSSGMGETGETYLVGIDGLMRSDSRFFSESSVLKTTVTSPPVDKALAGEIGVEITEDYRGVLVYSAYQPFDFEGTRWAVLAEKDVAEVVAPVKGTLRWMVMGYGLIILVGLLLRSILLHIIGSTSLAVSPGPTPPI